LSCSIACLRSVEGIVAALEKENSDWAKQQLATLAKMSPTSLKVHTARAASVVWR
jgi:hypothetical protein